MLITSCSNTRYISKGKYLLKSNKVSIEQKINLLDIKNQLENKSELESAMLQYAKQKPNRKTLFLFKINLYAYNIANKGKIRKWKNWIINSFGEEPTIFDSVLVNESILQMKEYLNNQGYFDSEVKANFKLRGKSAKVFYTAYTNTLYKIDSVFFPEPTNTLYSSIDYYKSNTLLKKGESPSLDLFNSESKRITNDLMNLGYYRFNNRLVKYDLDTNRISGNTNVSLRILNDTVNNAQSKYYIKSVKVYPNYSAQNESLFMLKEKVHNFLFYYDTTSIKNEVISNIIFINPGDEYNKKNYDLTISRLSDINIFKFVSIKFSDLGNDSLDCDIRLTPAKRRKLSADLEGYNIENNLGTGVKFSYKNFNWLKMANSIVYNINLGTEIPLISTGNPIVDGSMNLTFTFPKFYLPWSYNNVSRNYNPKTRLGVGVNFQRRSNFYQLASYNFTFGYDWRDSKTKRHILNPFTLTVLDSRSLSNIFQSQLDADPQLKLSFQNQIISGANYSFIYTNQSDDIKSFNYLKIFVENSGFIVWQLQKIFKNAPPQNGSSYQIFGLPYSTFSKLEFDYRRYFLFPNYKNRRLITRLFAGTAFHYWNSQSSLPYIKQYYSGGSNGIRAWRVRTLGPGSYNVYANSNPDDQVFINQTGEIKLETNIEYRFPIFGVLKGAVFTDAGNIWLLNKSLIQENANFELDRFYKEIAIGSGIGFRLDFSYFIVRLDIAVPIHDPISNEFGSEWIFNNSNIRSISDVTKIAVYNIAIDYPF
jgi:outer membrane protein insertion porin family